jgi:hypothetical protein
MDPRKRVPRMRKDYLARERIPREQFAFKMKPGKSTVGKLLMAGPPTECCPSPRATPPVRKMLEAASNRPLPLRSVVDTGSKSFD